MSLGAYTPTFTISKDGEDITSNFQNRATDIKVELCSGNGAQDMVTITLDDRDWLIATPHVGDKISVSLGYVEVGMAEMGTFEIDEVTFAFPPKSVSIHGNSVGFNSPIKSPVQKNYEQKSVKEIVESIGQQLGLSVKVDSTIGSQMIDYRNTTTSPMHVLGQLERQFGGVAKISNGQLAFASRDSGLSSSGETIPLVVLRAEHFADAQVKHTNRSDYSKTTAQWRNKDTNQDETVEATTKASPLGQGESSTDRPYPIKGVFNTRAEAQAAAEAQMKQLDRDLGEGLFTLATGDPWIRDQNRILVIGTREGVDGSYVADLVMHQYGKDGALHTSIRTQPDGGGLSFASLYDQEPQNALAPGPGQVTGDVLPKAGGIYGSADPGAM